MGSCGSKPTGCGMGIRRKKNPTRKRLVVRKTSSLSHKLSQVDSSVSIDRSYCNPTYQGIDFIFFVYDLVKYFVGDCWFLFYYAVFILVGWFDFVELLIVVCVDIWMFCRFRLLCLF